MKFKDNEMIWESYKKKIVESDMPQRPYYQDEEDDDKYGGIALDKEGNYGGIVITTGEGPKDHDYDHGGDHETEGHLEFEMEDEDHEIDEVMYSDIKKLAEYSNRLLKNCHDLDLDCWMKAKIIKASDYVSDVWHRLDAKADFANDGHDMDDHDY